MDRYHYHPQSLARLRTDALTRGAYLPLRSVLAVVLQHPMGGGVGSGPAAEYPVGGGVGSNVQDEYPVGGGIGSDPEDKPRE